MIYYLGLEPYRERYTELLTGWVEAAAARNGRDIVVVPGVPMSGADRIRIGQVLDAAGRGHWALTQTANLLASCNPTADDWVWIDDMFHPGIEALPYLWEQAGERPKLAVRCHAQTVDPDDFTFPMRRWMRPYERMVCEVADVVFVASTVHREMLETAMLDKADIRVVGLPYDDDAVRRIGPPTRPWDERPMRVVYSSRLDREKQPHFFLDVVAEAHGEIQYEWGQPPEFVVCTGSDEPRSNDPTVVPRLAEYAADGWLTVAAGLTKQEYYGILADARVQLNTARQDFVSYTACEASSFGVPTLAPAFRSFPETLENRPDQLYVPWSVGDATTKLMRLLNDGVPHARWRRVAEWNHGSLDRILEVLR